MCKKSAFWGAALGKNSGFFACAVWRERGFWPLLCKTKRGVLTLAVIKQQFWPLLWKNCRVWGCFFVWLDFFLSFLLCKNTGFGPLDM